MPKEKFVSDKIQITHADLQRTKIALKITAPIYTASKRGRVVTIVTRLRVEKYTIPTKAKSKKART